MGRRSRRDEREANEGEMGEREVEEAEAEMEARRERRSDFESRGCEAPASRDCRMGMGNLMSGKKKMG